MTANSKAEFTTEKRRNYHPCMMNLSIHALQQLAFNIAPLTNAHIALSPLSKRTGHSKSKANKKRMGRYVEKSIPHNARLSAFAKQQGAAICIKLPVT